MTGDDFIFGAQYYRAPTPEKENWEQDLLNMKKSGMTHVKFWVQWRWTHRGEDEFYFDDTDALMDIAAKNGLKVTLNVIFDVAPLWVTKKYEDSLIVLANGKRVEPMAVGHRQIGGFPGVCYSHKEAFLARMRFLEETVKRYKDHPAMDMWDVWNEPEQCGPYRDVKVDELSCYCDNCRKDFILWLENKYSSIEKLNAVWGRCYKSFLDVEIPRERHTYADFIDYREFCLDKMTKEANERIRLIKSLDKKHKTYLHVVPNTSAVFNSLTCVDDFDLAKECDIFASTNFAGPIWSVATLSAGAGKPCYNVECHIGSGTTKIHQRRITLSDMVRDLVPQIGMGIRGFMFWQYRPEILGLESPAWGMTNLDGSPGCVGISASEFIKRLSPYLDRIMKAKPKAPDIAVWKGRKNEILSFCIDNDLQNYARSVEAYVSSAYDNNYTSCIVNDEALENGLENIKLLILPYCYGADKKLAMAVDKFVLNGGTVLCEAHFGGYNLDKGRHSYVMPGLGLDKLWDIKEEYTTGSYHLDTLANSEELNAADLGNDMKKAIAAYGLAGGKNFKIKTTFGFELMGSERFASLSGEGAEIIGTFGDIPCIVKQKRGAGTIYYCGTNLGESAMQNKAEFGKFFDIVARAAGAKKNHALNIFGLHIDEICDEIFAVTNYTGAKTDFELDGEYAAVFDEKAVSGKICSLEAGCAEILIKK